MATPQSVEIKAAQIVAIKVGQHDKRDSPASISDIIADQFAGGSLSDDRSIILQLLNRPNIVSIACPQDDIEAISSGLVKLISPGQFVKELTGSAESISQYGLIDHPGSVAVE